MKLMKFTILFSVFSCAMVSAQTYTNKELLLIADKNISLQTFLTKQEFPKTLDRESAITFAEKQQLLRDGRVYKIEGSFCKNVGFNFVDIGNDFNEPEVIKTIAANQEVTTKYQGELDRILSKLGMNKSEYQSEWDKVIKKFGKPRYIEVSQEVFPNNKVGMIDFITYKIIYNDAPIFVRFELTSYGCLTTKVSYIMEKNARKSIDEIISKQNKKSTIDDALK